MRNIKLKFWDKVLNCWSGGSHHLITAGKFEWSPETGNRYIPVEFTGLKDRNGVEIYEGDIVVLKAIWGGFQADIIFENGCFGVRDGCAVYTFQDTDSENLEVIGNIYDKGNR